MPTKTRRSRKARELKLRAPVGLLVATRALDLAWTSDGDKLVELRLRISVDASTYETVDSLALFHLEPEVRGENFLDDFQTDQRYDLVLVLEPEQLAAVADQSDGPEAAFELIDGLSRRRAKSRLTETESWYAISVTQDMGNLKAGFNTRWADSKAAKRKKLVLEI